RLAVWIQSGAFTTLPVHPPLFTSTALQALAIRGKPLEELMPTIVTRTNRTRLSAFQALDNAACVWLRLPDRASYQPEDYEEDDTYQRSHGLRHIYWTALSPHLISPVGTIPSGLQTDVVIDIPKGFSG